MPTQTPPDEVLAAILAPETTWTRRIEIYEADAQTLWASVKFDKSRLISGGVSVDYSRTERRTFDVVLSNVDKKLKPSPDGFWYDKIIKPFRGISYKSPLYKTVINLIPNPSFNADTPGSSVANGYTFYGGGAGFNTGSMMIDGAFSFGLGNSVKIINGHTSNPGGYNGGAYATNLPLEIGKTYTVSVYAFADVGGTNMQVYVDSYANFPAVALTTGWVRYSFTFVATQVYNNILPRSNTPDATWHFDLLQVEPGPDLNEYVDGSLPGCTWDGTPNYSSSRKKLYQIGTTDNSWEMQLGEFMIDRIDGDSFPHTLKITGRDYSKKMQLSKLSQATTFASGQSASGIIAALASNAGCNKRIFPLPSERTNTLIDFVFDKGTSRWDAAKKVAEAYGWEIFFDPKGYLILRDYLDPVLSPSIFTFRTGLLGSLVQYTKSTNDSRLYNHVAVTGTANQDTLPAFAEVANTEPSSPTRVSRIGDRLYEYESPFISTNDQALDVALKFLKIHALESFELSLTSLVIPWLEAGEIITFLDPDPATGDPTSYLLTNFTVPLELGSMGLSANRVTIVTSSYNLEGQPAPGILNPGWVDFGGGSKQPRVEIQQ